MIQNKKNAIYLVLTKHLIVFCLRLKGFSEIPVDDLAKISSGIGNSNDTLPTQSALSKCNIIIIYVTACKLFLMQINVLFDINKRYQTNINKGNNKITEHRVVPIKKRMVGKNPKAKVVLIFNCKYLYLSLHNLTNTILNCLYVFALVNFN